MLDDNDMVRSASRAICWAKRPLEILDRLGCGEALAEKGVTWQLGRTFHRDRQVFNFDLLPEDGHKMPGLRQPATVLLRGIPGRAPRWTSAPIDLRVANQVDGARNAGPTTSTVDDRDARRPYELEAD